MCNLRKTKPQRPTKLSFGLTPVFHGFSEPWTTFLQIFCQICYKKKKFYQQYFTFASICWVCLSHACPWISGGSTLREPQGQNTVKPYHPIHHDRLDLILKQIQQFSISHKIQEDSNVQCLHLHRVINLKRASESEMILRYWFVLSL